MRRNEPTQPNSSVLGVEGSQVQILSSRRLKALVSTDAGAFLSPSVELLRLLGMLVRASLGQCIVEKRRQSRLGSIHDDWVLR